ncbi:MAG: hypothetical protein ACP5NZ_01870 [Nanobdellota archaeon]
MSNEERNLKKKKEKKVLRILFVFGMILFSLFLSHNIFLSAANPVGPSSIDSEWNETKNTTSAGFFNFSGGYIAALNLSASVQNTHWKAFVGWITAGFTLDDQGGSTIYDWTSAVTSGRVYATRDSSTIEWNLIDCANVSTTLAAEDTAMSHNISLRQDTINTTFVYPGTHDPFWVAGHSFSSNECPTLNTYVNSGSQDGDFEEMALYDSTSIIYATILEEGLAGYDGQTYDFQMLVPENGSQSFSGATAYYIYVELE